MPQQIQHGKVVVRSADFEKHITYWNLFCVCFPKPSITKSLLFHFPGDFSSVPSGLLSKAETCQKNAEPRYPRGTRSPVSLSYLVHPPLRGFYDFEHFRRCALNPSLDGTTHALDAGIAKVDNYIPIVG